MMTPWHVAASVLAALALSPVAQAANDAVAWAARFRKVALDAPAGELLTLNQILPLTKLQRMTHAEGCQKLLGLAPQHAEYLWMTLVRVDGQGDDCGRYKVLAATYGLSVRQADAARILRDTERTLGEATHTRDGALEVLRWRLSPWRTLLLTLDQPEDGEQGVGLAITQDLRR